MQIVRISQQPRVYTGLTAFLVRIISEHYVKPPFKNVIHKIEKKGGVILKGVEPIQVQSRFLSHQNPNIRDVYRGNFNLLGSLHVNKNIISFIFLMSSPMKSLLPKILLPILFSSNLYALSLEEKKQLEASQQALEEVFARLNNPEKFKMPEQERYAMQYREKVSQAIDISKLPSKSKCDFKLKLNDDGTIATLKTLDTTKEPACMSIYKDIKTIKKFPMPKDEKIKGELKNISLHIRSPDNIND